MPKGVFLYEFLRKTEKVRGDPLRSCGALRRNVGRFASTALRGRPCAREIRGKKNCCNVLNFIPKEDEKKSKDENGRHCLKFTNKEILKMPKTFRRFFRAEHEVIFYRIRVRGIRSCSYEARYRRHGYNISVSAPTFDELKKRFIEALHATEADFNAPKVPTNFDEFAQYYFENFRKRKVQPLTLVNDKYRYNNHLKPLLGSMNIKDITPAQCQKLIDNFIEKGQGKTADEVYSLLNVIFKMAIAHGILGRNPLAIIVKEKHISKHGTALTKNEEQELLTRTAGTRYQLLFAVALFTGLRPNEFYTARIKGDFIVAVNSKRKTQRTEYKRIPITPMLRPYLVGVDELHFPRIEYMRDKIKEILPNHKLYDLRTTFYTRCQECEVADVARMEFVGHSLGALGDTYTDLSDEFLLKEGNKLKY